MSKKFCVLFASSCICLSIILFVLTIPETASGATFYVATNGNDSNGDGSIGNPWRTIQKCVNMVSAGSTCQIGPGTFYERVTFSRSGTAANRITVKGSKSGATFQTIVDGSETLTGWTQDFGVDPNGRVWKTIKPTWMGGSGLTSDPCSMTADGKTIWKIAWRWSDGGEYLDGTWQDHLSYPSNATFTWDKGTSMEGTVFLWDGIEALFANVGSYTYLRFRNGDNPNSKSIRVAPSEFHCNGIPEFATLKFSGVNYITVQDLQIQGGATQVLMTNGASNNIVQNNVILDGDVQVLVYGTAAAGNAFRGNTMNANGIGYTTYTPGAWEGGYVLGASWPYATKVSQHIYGRNKGLIGDSDSKSRAFLINGNNTEISNNTMTNQVVKIQIYTGVGVQVFGNTLQNGSSVGFYWQGQSSGTLHIYDNTVINVNIPFRANAMQNPPDSTFTGYFYRNKIWTLPQIGSFSDLQTYGANAPTTVPQTLYFYHNTHIGGYATAVFDTNIKMPRVLWVNNLMQGSATGVVYQNWGCCTMQNSSDGLAGWDYNWTYAGTRYAWAWDFSHNVNSNSKIFDDRSVPTTWVPSSSALGAGVDISRTFSVGGVTYSPLPGFSPGYFSGGAPNIGAVQDKGSLAVPNAPALNAIVVQ